MGLWRGGRCPLCFFKPTRRRPWPTPRPLWPHSGNKAALRPLHEELAAAIAKFGSFEAAPKKSYISMRRKKQFAMLGPATQTALELGLNAKDLAPAPRLKLMPPGAMCQYTIRVSDAKEIDAQLLAWLRVAFDAAG